jgi:hypothetical protein
LIILANRIKGKIFTDTRHQRDGLGDEFKKKRKLNSEGEAQEQDLKTLDIKEE